MHLQDVAPQTEEVRHELRSVVGQQCRRRTILKDQLLAERDCDIVGGCALKGATFVNFVKPSEITSMNKYSRLLFSNGPRISIATDSNRAVAGMSFILLALRRSRSLFLAQTVRSGTAAPLSAAMCGQ